ncbi:MAG: hypothetical protein Q8O92_14900 [Candidatus Latescibacter sp.]|nr:hypothetical protein [Candidatus Latescibacter sp.]
MNAWHNMNIDEVLIQLQSDSNQGLTSREYRAEKAMSAKTNREIKYL